MNHGKIKIWAIVWCFWTQGQSSRQAEKIINDLLGPSTVSKSNVAYWFKRLNDRDETLEDQDSSGRPIKVDDDEIIKLMEGHSSISSQDIAEELSFTPQTVSLHLRRLGYTNKLDKLDTTSTQ